MTRVALHARYSSDNQREASIGDQWRLCRLHAERQGCAPADSCADRAISGAALLRPGIQELIADAQRGRFDVILTESLDRLSGDQEDIAGLYKRMRFAGVGSVTLTEGDISELHISLKGAMGALYLKDLADKTRHGLRGRVERDLDRAIQAILDGVPGAQLKKKIGRLEGRKTELASILAEATEPPTLLHPSMAEIYHTGIVALHEALSDNATRAEAAETLSTMVDRATLVPEHGELGIVVRGDLAAMLTFATNAKKPPRERDGFMSQLSLVAGAGFEPATFRL